MPIFDGLRRETIWHLAHGERTGVAVCAGCRRFFGLGEEWLELANGNAVHLTDDYRSLIHYGERWRGKARAAVSQTPAATTENTSLSATFARVRTNQCPHVEQETSQ